MDKEDVVEIHNGIPLGHRNEQNNVIFSNMDGPRDCHWVKQVRQKKTNIIWYCLYVEFKKSGTNEPVYKREVESEM